MVKGKKLQKDGSLDDEFPLWYKIDFFGSIILLTNIYLISLLFASASTNYLYLNIPNELLIHGPIIINVTSPSATKPIACNPNFKLFRRTYLSESIKNQEEVRSATYLAVPAVRDMLDGINEARNRTVTTFGMSPRGLCELIPPANDWGDCITNADFNDLCLEGDCGTDVNFCFWDTSRIVNFCAYAQIVTYITAVLMTFGLMFDPPPAKFGPVLSPKICASVYLVSGILSSIGLVTCVTGVSRYASNVIYSTYPEFYVSYDAGWQCFLFTSLASVSFSICYFYLGCFTPEYPRLRNRWELRRKKFEKGIERIKENVTQEV